jgi:hypothetical protein
MKLSSIIAIAVAAAISVIPHILLLTAEVSGASFFILDMDIKNCEWNSGLADDLYNEIIILE